MNPKSVQALVISARLIVTLIALWLIAIHIDRSMLLSLLAQADPGSLALAGIVMTTQFAIMVWRWQLVIGLLNCGSVAAGPLAIALGRSMLIGQPLPSTVGSDVVRVFSLSPQIGMACAARSVVCDRIISFATLLVLVALTLPLFFLFVESGSAFAAVATISIGSLIVFMVIITHPRWLLLMPWLASHASVIVADLRWVFQSGEKGRLILLLSLITHLCGVLLMYKIAVALATPISLANCLIIFPSVLLISAFPISLGGWGVREGALAAGFVMVGMSSEAGVATSILFGLTGPLIGLMSELAMPFVRMRKIPPEDAL